MLRFSRTFLLLILFLRSRATATSGDGGISTQTQAPQKRDSWHKFDGYEYLVSSIAFSSFQESKEECAKTNGTLALIKSNNIQNFLRSLVVPGSGPPHAFFIGLIKENGNWIWEDDLRSAPTFTAWGVGEPSSGSPEENCVVIGQLYVYQEGLTWNNVQCENKNEGKKGYICERYLGVETTTSVEPVTTTPTKEEKSTKEEYSTAIAKMTSTGDKKETSTSSNENRTDPRFFLSTVGGYDAQTTSNLTGTPQPEAIAGGTVGSLVLLAGIVIVIQRYRYKKRKQISRSEFKTTLSMKLRLSENGTTDSNSPEGRHEVSLHIPISDIMNDGKSQSKVWNKESEVKTANLSAFIQSETSQARENHQQRSAKLEMSLDFPVADDVTDAPVEESHDSAYVFMASPITPKAEEFQSQTPAETDYEEIATRKVNEVARDESNKSRQDEPIKNDKSVEVSNKVETKVSGSKGIRAFVTSMKRKKKVTDTSYRKEDVAAVDGNHLKKELRENSSLQSTSQDMHHSNSVIGRESKKSAQKPDMLIEKDIHSEISSPKSANFNLGGHLSENTPTDKTALPNLYSIVEKDTYSEIASSISSNLEVRSHYGENLPTSKKKKVASTPEGRKSMKKLKKPVNPDFKEVGTRSQKKSPGKKPVSENLRDESHGQIPSSNQTMFSNNQGGLGEESEYAEMSLNDQAKMQLRKLLDKPAILYRENPTEAKHPLPPAADDEYAEIPKNETASQLHQPSLRKLPAPPNASISSKFNQDCIPPIVPGSTKQESSSESKACASSSEGWELEDTYAEVHDGKVEFIFDSEPTYDVVCTDEERMTVVGPKGDRYSVIKRKEKT